MAKISLRAYNREIENRTEQGQIEEAIAHCKNIIKQFPKHIETYRLLGKAYLESQRYAEAADILQRVLSVFPDDFIAQLGMSIIREDEGNLDAAIWHMERAYEVQPFNRAVQDELRRLYGRRDGVEPPRIRLTRGALVRMYARGDLYPQAIAEIRAALAEDPQRVDLQAMLARMCALSGQKIEAAEICAALIEKLPYCYEANRILMDILPESSRPEEAQRFQQRVTALDPYAAFLSPNAPTSEQVPEQMVMAEKAEWQPGMAEEEAPDWAQSLGVAWEENKEEALPDWLNQVSAPAQEQKPVEAENHALIPELSESTELIPDFMKDAGWSPSDGAEPEAPADLETDAEAEADGEAEPLAEAEIPDWLKDLAPESLSEAEQEEVASEEDEQADVAWLNGLLPQEPAAPPDDRTKMLADTLDEMEASQPGTSTPTETAEPQAEFFWSESTEAVAPLDKAPNDGLEWQPEEAVGQMDEAVSNEETPLLPSIEPAVPVFIEESTETRAEMPPTMPEHVPAFADQDLKRSIEDTQPVATHTVLPQEPEEGQVQPAEEEQTAIPAAEDLPGWLRGLGSEEIGPESSAESSAGEAETPFARLDEEVSAESVDEMSLDEAMAWMEGLNPDANQAEPEEVTAPESVTIVEEPPVATQPTDSTEAPIQPDYGEVEEVAGETVAAEATEAPVETMEASAEETATSGEDPAQTAGGQPNLEDLDSAMAWMEQLAAQSTGEASAPLEPETPAIELAAEKTETEAPSPQTTQPESDAEPEGTETPEATYGSDQEPVQISATEPQPGAEADANELPSWLRDLASEESQPAATAEIAETRTSVAPAESDEDQIPAWLHAYQTDVEPLPSAQAGAANAEIPDQDAMPAWLVEDFTAEEAPAVESTATPPTEMSTEDAGEMPAWLKALQDEQGEPSGPPAAQPEPQAESTWEPEYPKSASESAWPVPSVDEPAEGALAQARALLQQGNIEQSVERFAGCIQRGEDPDGIIGDLERALDLHPVDVSLWQTLGDAYMKRERIQDALTAYTKAEELLG